MVCVFLCNTFKRITFMSWNIQIGLYNIKKQGCELRFIMPLKRDNAQIDYSMIRDNTFKEHDQYF